MRLFVGLALDEATAAMLAGVVERAETRGADVRWMTPESWHVTLQFLGASSEEHLQCLMRLLAEVHGPRLEVPVRGSGVFEGVGILYAGVELTPELARLQEQVVAATAGCGFRAEERAYRPHITLARRRGRGAAGVRQAARGVTGVDGVLRADEFVLYESRMGGEYVVRGRFALRG